MGEFESPPPESSEQPSRVQEWSVPSSLSVEKNQLAINKETTPIITPAEIEGKHVGKVVEIPFTTEPGTQIVKTEFSFDIPNPNDLEVITNGNITWSQSTKTESPTNPKNRVVGMQDYQDALGGKTAPFYEPGPRSEVIPSNEGRSYGYVSFRNPKTGEDLFVGSVPNLDTAEKITFTYKEGKLVVAVEKDFEAAEGARESKFRIFLGNVNAKEKIGNYGDLMEYFSKELEPLKGDLPIMKDRVAGFTWPIYGTRVTQDDVRDEVAAAENIDTFYIDDGWETASGSMEIDTKKFPDLADVAATMKAKGIKPGIWVSPFMIKSPAAEKLPEGWLARSSDGKAAKVPIPLPTDALIPVQNPYCRDISNPEVENDLIEKFVKLNEMGFESFKTDFLSALFTVPLGSKDKTSVEYYRDFFTKVREVVKEKTGKEIEIVGCGAPVMESLGLFNGMRITGDSAWPDPGYIPKVGKLLSFADRITRNKFTTGANTQLYTDAVAVAARRVLAFKDFGLIFDGLHMPGSGVPMDAEKQKRFNQAYIAIKRLGISNVFLGDSFKKMSEDKKAALETFIQNFKEGKSAHARNNERTENSSRRV